MIRLLLTSLGVLTGLESLAQSHQQKYNVLMISVDQYLCDNKTFVG